MNSIIHQITLCSDEDFGKRLPPQPTGRLLQSIPGVVESAISMAFRGRSSTKGMKPAWLSAAADVRFLLANSQDSQLRFEAPRLGDVAAEVYDQGLLWDSRPNRNDTGFDLLGDVLADVDVAAEDSERFDPGMLKRIVHFKRILNGTFREL